MIYSICSFLKDGGGCSLGPFIMIETRTFSRSLVMIVVGMNPSEPKIIITVFESCAWKIDSDV